MKEGVLATQAFPAFIGSRYCGTFFAKSCGSGCFFLSRPQCNMCGRLIMSELISSLRPQDNNAIFENLQARLREMSAGRQTDAASSPAVKMQMRPSPKMLDEAEAVAGVSRMQEEAQRGVDVAAVHNGLDPQRVAKLLGLLD
jgi:hypothetical protein